jgi:transcriptional regulator with XRE-family HTH domain
VQKAYDEMSPEFEVAKALIAARVNAGLTQEEVAQRMGTKQSVIARLEAGRSLPSMMSLYRYAAATGTKPNIRLVLL